MLHDFLESLMTPASAHLSIPALPALQLLIIFCKTASSQPAIYVGISQVPDIISHKRPLDPGIYTYKVPMK